MIERFEHEYPETRQRAASPSTSVVGEVEPVEPQFDARSRASSTEAAGRASYEMPAEEFAPQSPTSWQGSTIHPGSRRGSQTNLASRALVSEEASMHRLGQQLRRQVLPPTGITDYLHGTSASDVPEPEHLAALRARIGILGGEELRETILEKGLEQTVKEIVQDAERLRILELEEPAKFQALREAQASLGL